MIITFDKTYDHLDWNSVDLDLFFQAKGFGCKLRQWIKGCLQSVNFWVFINERFTEEFCASRGIRQGDPLFPFLLVVDGFNKLMIRAAEAELVKGISIDKATVEVSRLQFADATLFFSMGDEQKIAKLLKVVDSFGLISSLKVNMAKSLIVAINSWRKSKS